MFRENRGPFVGGLLSGIMGVFLLDVLPLFQALIASLIAALVLGSVVGLAERTLVHLLARRSQGQ